jgi:hypothetical protein
MLSFAEIVAESFESPEVLVTWRVLSTGHVVALFRVSGFNVAVDFEQRETDGPWHARFKVDGNPPISSAFRIFNGVFQTVREFLSTREPQSAVFVAKDEDLADIYAAYLRRESKALERLGYALQGPERIEPYTAWTVKRVQPSAWREV